MLPVGTGSLVARSVLSPWPAVVAALERRGIVLEAMPSETRDEFENRLCTALMVLFRDSRETRAFEALYAFARPGVLSWVRSLVGRDPAGVDPSEVLQDTFVNVYRYPGAFREEHEGSFRVWVRTIAGNVVRRSAALRSRTPAQDLSEAATDLEDRGRGPVEAVLDEEQERRLRVAWVLLLWHYAQAWKDLSQRDRRTLHLVEVEGLSYEESGRILCVGRSNMKMIVFRSRRRIARRMRQSMRAAQEPRRASAVA